ncbi:Ig-like domain-containing protein [Candidatus Uhrbacteria bacterium]|nr:Ig-like domain-containing protein [Candidatus Uhrbacteria bacterium]
MSHSLFLARNRVQRFVIWTAVFALVVWFVGLQIGIKPAKANHANTFALDVSAGNFGPLRLKQGSAFQKVLEIDFGSNENGKTLTSVTISFTGTSGSPTWTNGQAVSSELADLATTNGGLSLWKETSGSGFSSTADTQVTLAASPVYGAANSFVITPATPPSLVTEDVYYVVLKSDSSGVTNNNTFTVTVAANGVATSGSSPTITQVITQSITMDTAAPTISSTVPAAGAMSVPISTTPRVTFSEGIDPTTINPTNVTFTTGGNPAPAGIRPMGDSIEVVTSSPPSFASGSRFAKATIVYDAFFPIAGTNPIVPNGAYQSPTVGDVVFFQHDTFPPELGLVTSATLTSGTFAVNGFPLMMGHQITKLATPAATGLVTASTSVTTGDLMVVNTSANPTDQRYNWHLVTTGAAVNGASLRIDGAGSAPTFVSGSRFSTITPAATATDNGSTNGGTLAVSVGDLVFAKVGVGNYGWHLATGAGNLSSNATEGTASLDGATAANSLVTALSQMSRLTPAGQGLVTDTSVTFNVGDLLFASTTANAANNGAYNFHMVTDDGAGNITITNPALRLDNAPGALTASTNYTITIGTGVTDRAGNALASQSVTSFTTGSTGTSNTTPPAVQSSVPQPGEQSAPPNGIIRLTFSVDMSSASVTSSTNVGLFTDNFGAPGDVITAVNNYDSSTRTVSITPTATLATGNSFIVRVATSTLTSTNVPFGQEYRLYFRTASVSDSVPPTVGGAFPAAGATGVSRSVVSTVGFSEDMNSSTITNTTITLVKTVGAVPVAGTAVYNPSSRSASFSPSTLLEANTGYTLRVVSGVNGVRDVAANALNADYTTTFTTDTADDLVLPRVSFSSADNFSVAVTFSETMKTGAGPNAADNIANYTLESPVGSSIALGGKTITYDGMTRTSRITGLSLQAGTAYRVLVAAAVQDLAANGMDTTETPARNTAYGTVADANTTGGQIGPGTGTINPGMQGQNPTRVTPMNRAAGATSNYKVEFLAATSVPSGGQIVLTFPSGFTVTNALNVATSSSFCNADMNGPGTGTVTISSITNNNSAGTITVVTSGVSGANAFLCMDLSGLVNSTVPNSAGYTVDIKTRDTVANNLAVLESKVSAPFFLGTTGNSALTVTVFNDNGAQAGNNIKEGDEAGINAAKVMIFNPSIGGQSATTNSSGVATFSNLANGDYMVGVDPSSVTAAGFAFNSAPQLVTVSGNTSKNFGMRAAPYAISGTITGTGLSGTAVDIFASSPNGFVKRTLSLTGGADAYTLPAQANTTYNVGVGPAMPDNFTDPGAPPPPPPNFNFMPPSNLQVAVASANVPNTNFSLTATNKTIAGTVVDASGTTGVSNAGVFCRPSQSSTTGGSTAGFGTGGMTNTSGAFTINVIPGVYLCGVFKPGMPPASEKQITVPTTGTNTPTSLSFVLDASTSLTITGTIKDESGSAIPYAGVGGRKVTSTTDTTAIGGDSSNFVGGPADANGAYTLYVTAGTWVVEAFAPTVGRLGTKTITVGTSNVTGQDFTAQTLSLGTITGTVTSGGAAVQGVMVRAQNAAGTSGNMAVTNINGVYNLKVPAGTYTVFAFLPGVGEATPLTGVAVTANTETPLQNFTLAAPIIITVNVTDGTNPVANAGIDVRDANGRGNFSNVSVTSGANAVYTISAPPGTYTVRVGHPAYGPISTCPNAAALTGVNSTRTITCTLSSQTYAVSGLVTLGGDPLSGAWAALIGTPTAGSAPVFLGAQTASNGAFSINVPPGSYRLRVDKPGYLSPAETTVTVTNAPVPAGTIALTAATLTITGQITISGVGGVSGAFVDAFNGSGGYAVAQTDTSGNYSLAVATGTWSVRAHSLGYDGGPLSVAVSGVNRTGQDIALTAISGFTIRAEKPETVTPNSGGFITNPDVGANFKVNIPANSLGTSSNASTVTTKVNTAVPTPPTGSVLAKNAVTISAVDSSGSPVKNLSGDPITVVVPYDEANVPSGVAEASLVLGVYNDATQTYETLTTTVDTTLNTLTATTTHLSDFAPLAPSGSSPPSTPANHAISNSGVGSVLFTWTAVSGATSYNIYRSTDNSSFPLVTSVTSASYSASGLAAGVTLYYKVSAVNLTGESAATSAVSVIPTGPSVAGGGGGSSAPTTASTLTLTSPNGSEKLTAGTAKLITWTSGGSGISTIKILLSSDSGLGFPTTIASGEVNDGGYSWTVPNLTGSKFRVKLEGVGSGGVVFISDISDADFSISPSAVSAIPPAVTPSAEVPGVSGGTTFNPPSATSASPSINADKGLAVAASAPCVSDTLVKSQASTAVYYCGSDGKRYVFPNDKVYFTWYADFSKVTMVSDAVLASLQLGGVVTYRPGVKMIKIESDPKVYAVAPNGLLRWVSSEAIAVKLYGTDWNKQIDDLAVSFFARYQTGPDITE